MANFKLPALVSGFSCRQTQRYGSMELCLLWRLPRTRYNEHGRAETVQSLYSDQGPLRPRNLMSKFTRCSHPSLLIHINSSISQRNRRHPQPIIPHPKNILPTPCGIPHPTLSLSRPILVHSSIHLHRRPSSAQSKPTPDPSTIPFSPLNTETEIAAALVSDASITIVNLRSTNNASARSSIDMIGKR